MSVSLMSKVFSAKIGNMEYTYHGDKRVARESALKIVLLALADHANDQGESSYPGLTLLETKTGLSRQGVVLTLAALEQNGYLTIESASSRLNTNNYTIIVSKLVNTVDYQLVNTVDQGSQHSRLKPSLTINDDKGVIFKIYESTIGPVTSNLVDDLKSAATDYPQDWIEKAFKIAAERNARNWSFVKACLRNMQANGVDWSPNQKKQAETVSLPTEPPAPVKAVPPPEYLKEAWAKAHPKTSEAL